MKYLYDKLKFYGMSDYYPYHMPGHKRRLCAAMPKELFKADITEIDGFDNLHQPEGILKELHIQAAGLYGSEESFYLINGSTCGILSAVSAALPQNGHLLMARNCHKSAYHAAYLRNLTVSYLYPSILQAYNICEPVTAQQVKQALEQEPDIGAVLIVSPTYEGRIAQVGEIATVVHDKKIPLIVDEAHGAHLGFHKAWPPNSNLQGADLVIHSVHKTLPALTQTALLHVNGTLVNRDRLRRFLHIYQSSSPSYILMASIHNALCIVEERKEELFGELEQRFKTMYSSLKACRHLMFLPLDYQKQDIGKLVISTRKTKLSGQQLYDMLLQDYHIQLEMATIDYCLAMFTIADGEEGFSRMTQALLEIDGKLTDQAERKESSDITGMLPKCAHPLAQAWDSPMEYCLLKQSEGRISGDFINLYPPGIPIAAPGEVLTTKLCGLIEDCLDQGLAVQGVRHSPQGPLVCTLSDKL